LPKPVAPPASPCATVAPVAPVAPPASPCATVAPARKYDAKEAVLTQEATKKDASLVPAWAFPFFGVVAMFSLAAGFAVRARGARRSTRQIQVVEPVMQSDELDDEPLLAWE